MEAVCKSDEKHPEEVEAEIKGLEKRFKNDVIFSDVYMTLFKGNIYGLVGRNGTGKTVFMKCICGFLCPTKGKVIIEDKIIGEDVDFPDSLGVMIETPGFIPYMSGKSNLKNLALIKNNIKDDEIDNAMIEVGLDPGLKKRVSKYSLGMKQRLGIAQAIMEHPRLLVLDEPFNGLDRKGAEEIKKLFKKMRDKGTTFIIASHLKEDLVDLCDEVFGFEDGKIVKREFVDYDEI